MNEETSEDFHVKCPLLGPFLTKICMRQQISWKTSGFRCGCCSNHGISWFFTPGSVFVATFRNHLSYCLCLHCGWIGSGGQCNDWTETYSELRPAISWDFVPFTLVVCYRHFGPIFKVQADCLAPEDGSDRLARNVGSKLPIPGQPEITYFF